MLRVWVLYADGRLVARADAFVLGSKVFADTNIHVPAYNRYSVGNVLIGHVQQACIDQELTELDLSRDVESYKYRWGSRKNIICACCWLPEVCSWWTHARLEIVRTDDAAVTVLTA